MQHSRKRREKPERGVRFRPLQQEVGIDQTGDAAEQFDVKQKVERFVMRLSEQRK